MNTCMKAKFLLCSCWCFLGLAIAVQGQDTLTVMSYNIYHAENPETAQSTIRELGRFINQVEPDFVALQEVDEQTQRLAKVNSGRHFSLTDSLAKLTSMTGYFAKTINFDGGKYGIATLSRKPVKTHKIKLPNPQKGESRVLFYLDTRIRLGTEFIFSNVHLDHQYPENRFAQVKRLNEFLSKQDKPVILAGDFNFTPNSKSYGMMKSQWIDVAFDFIERPTFTYPSQRPSKRIDYIFLSRNVEWKIIDFQVYKLAHSDHLPIIAKIVIPDK